MKAIFIMKSDFTMTVINYLKKLDKVYINKAVFFVNLYSLIINHKFIT